MKLNKYTVDINEECTPEDCANIDFKQIIVNKGTKRNDGKFNVYANALYLITGKIIDNSFELPVLSNNQRYEIQHIPGPGDVNCIKNLEKFINNDNTINLDNNDEKYYAIQEKVTPDLCTDLKFGQLIVNIGKYGILINGPNGYTVPGGTYLITGRTINIPVNNSECLFKNQFMLGATSICCSKPATSLDKCISEWSNPDSLESIMCTMGEPIEYQSTDNIFGGD